MTGRPPCYLRAVIVNLKTDDVALHGILYDTRGEWWTLRNAAILKPGAPAVQADGVLIVHRSEIAFVQLPG